MMTSINLIPAPRRLARVRRRLRNRCILTCAGYAVALAVGLSVTRAAIDPGEGDFATRLTTAQEEVEQTERMTSGAKSDLEAALSLLKASRSIAEQPDWSHLMALLAARAGDEVSLKSCGIRPRDPEPAPVVARRGSPPPAPPKPVEPVLLLNLSGRGRSQADVSRFVLRLEATRLFGRVTLQDTSREVFERGEAIAFRIECSMDGQPSGSTSITGTQDVPANRRSVRAE